MAFLLVKKLCLSPPFPRPYLRQSLLVPLLRLSTEPYQAKDLPFMAQYLISSFGFSSDRALRVAASPQFSPIKTPDRPESVVRFFKETGFTDSQIKSMITWYPLLLVYHASKNFKPRVQELMAAGFTGDTLIQLIQYNPTVLCSKSALSRLQFWRDYTGSDLSLLKTLFRYRRLLQSDIDNVVKPSIKIWENWFHAIEKP